ncbi:hypothetical protein DKP78_13820 [Enterococcus faecium]|nr:hypothetical protein DKP78_13820 [Enterococcus faecium]
MVLFFFFFFFLFLFLFLFSFVMQKQSFTFISRRKGYHSPGHMYKLLGTVAVPEIWWGQPVH